MYLFRRIADLQVFLKTERVNNRALGFVPTMGALHAGHLSLIQQALAQNEITLASIFVNPTQFNDASDLKKYPRTPGKDLEKLAAVGCTAVFLPEVADIYPDGTDSNLSVDLGGLDTKMEGAKRPGHFDGVVQVVHRLLTIIEPQNLYMGQKDYQQQLIIRRMVEQLNLPLNVCTVPTKREDDGLAMSSRNVLLEPDIRSQATLLYHTLLEAKNRLTDGHTATKIEQWAMDQLSQPGFRPEYFSIINGKTLEPITTSLPEHIVACTAVWAGAVRLIDNMILRQ
ncbi:MAG: pantoate--beta-alanine ligase [Bacteroidota bacterium]